MQARKPSEMCLRRSGKGYTCWIFNNTMERAGLLPLWRLTGTGSLFARFSCFPTLKQESSIRQLYGHQYLSASEKSSFLNVFWKCLQRVVNELIYFICSPGSEFARGPGSKKEQRLQLAEEREPRKTKATKQTQLIGKPLEFPSPLYLNTKSTRSWLSQNS